MFEMFRKRRECFPQTLQRCLLELVQGSFSDNEHLKAAQNQLGGWPGYYAAAQHSLAKADADHPLSDGAAVFLKDFVQLLKPFYDVLAVFTSTSPTLSVVYGHVQDLFCHVNTTFQVGH